jgi:predicted TIM-barrel fold metal-dependent hydrolase
MRLGPEVGFARALYAAGWRDVAIIKVHGNFVPADISDSRWPWGDGGEMYEGWMRFVDARLQELGVDATHVQVRGLVWFQGIDDAFAGLEFAERYEANLGRLVVALRARFGCPEAPFVPARSVNSGFAKDQSKDGPMAIVRRAQVEVANALGGGETAGRGRDNERVASTWVDVDDLPNVNTHHFPVDAQLEIGRRLGVAMLRQYAAAAAPASGASHGYRPMRTCDAHHHFWDVSRGWNPWLLPDGVLPGFRYGDYAAIRRDYLPAEFIADSARFNVCFSVHVETEPARSAALAETEWLTAQHEAHGLPSAIVCAAWLDQPEAEVAALLAAQARFPLVRGVRHKPTAAASPAELETQAGCGGPPVRGSMSDPAWRRGYALLGRHGLSFDLQVPWWHLAEAAQLARDFPATLIVLNHAGLPADRGEGGLAGWRAGLAALAAEPNTALKISGIGVPAASPRWSVDLNRRVTREAIGVFGLERCMFASNFPVDSLCASYETIFGGFCEIIAELGLSDAQVDALFCDNALRFYRIPDAERAGSIT